jgi:hypothetical protein
MVSADERWGLLGDSSGFHYTRTHALVVERLWQSSAYIALTVLIHCALAGHLKEFLARTLGRRVGERTPFSQLSCSASARMIPLGPRR